MRGKNHVLVLYSCFLFVCFCLLFFWGFLVLVFFLFLMVLEGFMFS